MAETVKTRLDPTPSEDGIKPEKKGTGKKIIAGIAALGVAAAGVVGFNSINDDKEAPLGSGPIAEAPANPGTESSNESISEISPEILQAFEAISVSQAEQESGVTAEQIREYVKDPANTPFLKYLKYEAALSKNQRPSENVKDPFAIEAWAALDESNTRLLQQLLSEKKITPEILFDLYKWYRDNMEQIKIYLARPDLLGSERDMLNYAQFSQVVIARIIEMVVSGEIKLENKYDEKVDSRVKELCVEYYGSEEAVIERWGESPVGQTFIPTVENGELNMNSPYSVYQYVETFGELMSIGKIGPYQAKALQGANLYIEELKDNTGPSDVFKFLDRIPEQ